MEGMECNMVICCWVLKSSSVEGVKGAKSTNTEAGCQVVVQIINNGAGSVDL